MWSDSMERRAVKSRFWETVQDKQGDFFKKCKRQEEKNRKSIDYKKPRVLSTNYIVYSSLIAQMVKNLCIMQETCVRLLDQEDPWRRASLPTSVFLPGESHGQSSLAGYSPWGCKESDTTALLIQPPTLFSYWFK